MKIGPNQPCDCGSGKKWKKCCGARGRIPVVSVAEGMAHNEERWREHAKKPRKKTYIPAALFGLFAGMGAEAMSGPGPMPPKPKKRNRRKPQ